MSLVKNYWGGERMFLHKKWLAMLAIIAVIFLLGACGGKESAREVPRQEGPQDNNSNTILPLSDALEKYPVWFRVYDEPTRHSLINETFVFKDGKVQSYYTEKIDLHIEDVIDMSDEELIKYIRKEMKEYSIRINSDYEEPQPTEYTLDIILDDLGHNTQIINIESDETHISLNGQNVIQTIYDTNFSGLKYNDDDVDKNLITRVDDSHTLFQLDDPNTDKKNVTIEASKEKETKNESSEGKTQQDAEITETTRLEVEDKQLATEANGLKEKYLQKADALEAEIFGKAKELYAHDTEPGFYGQYFQNWDHLLNEVWGVLKENLPKNQFETLLADQQEWIYVKEQKFAAMPDETASARAAGMDYLANETKNRTYYLIENYMD